jgi:excisionase family DNA binding protein
MKDTGKGVPGKGVSKRRNQMKLSLPNTTQQAPWREGETVAAMGERLGRDPVEVLCEHLSFKVDFTEKPKREPKPRAKTTDGLLTLEEAADHLGVTPKTVVGYVNDHKLRAINLGRGKRPVYRFTPADLDTFTKLQEAKPCTSSVRPIRQTGTSSFGAEVVNIAARLRSEAAAKPKR